MIFSEKMALIPQPRRADLWNHYRVLCTALALQVKLRREERLPSESELLPLKKAAEAANEILKEYGMEPSFFSEKDEFFDLLIQELSAIAKAPRKKD